MQKKSHAIAYSPSDLCRWLDSRYATWMERFRLEHPEEAQPDSPDESEQLMARHGEQHEREVRARLEADGRDVVEISAADPFAATLEAMREGREVIHRAALSHGDFHGWADFLVRVDGPSALGAHHYEVQDAKLARRPKPYYLVQLCCYAEMLEALQGVRPESVAVVLGTGEERRFRTDDYFWYYRSLKRSFLRFMETFDPARRPVPDLGGDHGRWSAHAEAWLEQADHLSRVAGIRGSQVKKLETAGVTTIAGLAAARLARVPRMQQATYERLRTQARLQIESAGLDRPRYEVIPPDVDAPRRGLALLPPASRLDVFFDMEGYPLDDAGLEYLFGAAWIDGGGRRRFSDWWAHDPGEERRAFEAFVDWVHARWRDEPAMHIYHYAAYEVAALRRLMGRHGTREEEVDRLLRHEVFVDLYTVVRQGLIVGERSYSLKDVEKLYREARATEVGTAVDSIVHYEHWRDSGQPRDWKASSILAEIRAYNRDDCDSTLQLAAWLRERQRAHDVAFVPAGGEDDAAKADTLSETAQRRRDLAEDLLRRSATSKATPCDEMLGHLVEFHRREDKPVWWAMFDRAERTEEELIEDLACLGGLARTADAPVPVRWSRAFHYAFDPDQDTKLHDGDDCYLAHDLSTRVTIETLDRENGRVLLCVGPGALGRLGGEPPGRLSLIPDEWVPPEPITTSIEHVAREWLEKRCGPRALEDFLLRRTPRLRGHDGGALLRAGEDLAEGVIRVVSSMDDTTLCIQGPPGSGKTTTGARVILELLRRGARVGIASNSHKAVLNLMNKCSELSDWDVACLKVGGPEDDPLYGRCRRALRVESNDAAGLLDTYRLVGGTAWLFSREDMRARLDWLFVDEAGQVSVANLTGMAPSARNIVLIGDQMQLGQPIQGSHPGDSGASTLDYLLRGRATIAPEMGIFLATTYRMHPELCGLISGAFYEGRLRSAPGREKRVVRANPAARPWVTREAGVSFVPVDHEGNTQGSDEEVEVIHRIVDELQRCEHTDLSGESLGKLGPEDMLVVAPYNRQVRKLRAALPPGVPVGSVDKFQGQQAAVVIVSMCASDAAESPRGVEFLMNPNRLNVALSRAQSLAVVVGCPALAHTRCATVGQMKLVNLFCRVAEAGGAA
jgi:uncharacterized protein